MWRPLVVPLCLLLLAPLGGCGAQSSNSDHRANAKAGAAPASMSAPGDAARPASAMMEALAETPAAAEGTGPGQGGDKHAYLEENPFLLVADAPLSTFSIDVDTASYSKVRSFLQDQRSLPPPDAVRIEELVNYFAYDYSPPQDEHPFAVHLETAACPWQPAHRLLRCGIQGKVLGADRPASNLVFLIDVSGSMDVPNKLPLVKAGLEMLVRQLGENDRVAIVVYAGAAGLVLPSTSGAEQSRILAALDGLRAGGSTNGGQGIQLAYRVAQENFIRGGTNRVVLCSDGDFNVGVTSTGDLVRLAIEKSQAGIFLSVLGFGFGNHNDEMLEQIADRADGNYAFIDTQAEARKVLVEQMAGTLITIAKDVKIQVEFNPGQVAAYRLIGYENRLLAARDFNDDSKDAGEIGAGHQVTALYELVPVGAAIPSPEVDPLKYQPQTQASAPLTPDTAGEWLTLKLRYQPPQGGESTLLTFPVKDGGQTFGQASSDLQFAAAVASFGMLLRASRHRGDTSYTAVLETASAVCGEDRHGYRKEFLEIVRAASRLSDDLHQPANVPSSWSQGRSLSRQSSGVVLPAPQDFIRRPWARDLQPARGRGWWETLMLGMGLGASLVAASIGITAWLVSRRSRHFLVGFDRVPGKGWKESAGVET